MTRATPLLSLIALPLALVLALWMGLHRDAYAHDTMLAMAVLLSDEREMVYLLTLETGQFRAKMGRLRSASTRSIPPVLYARCCAIWQPESE